MSLDVLPAASLGGLPPFTCSWSPTGVEAAQVLVSGELDLATADELAQALQAALDQARLVVLDLRGLRFLDCAGVHVVVDAARRSRRDGRRLVVTRAPEGLDVFTLTRTAAELEFLDSDAPADDPRKAASIELPDAAEPSIKPLDNPVNATVRAARVMAIPDWQLWLHTEDGGVQRAWAPQDIAESVPPHAPIELYLDGRGELNGWRDPASGLAVNQRHLDHAAPPEFAEPMVCQGPCGVVWQAPAAALLAAHDECCLTCAGPLAAG